MRFTKMHGTGNDYIYVNAFVEVVEEPEKKAIEWSDRHKGIGADGLVLILPSEVADIRMRMFNADGTEAEMCGNASRCVGKYAYEKGLLSSTTISLETLAGVKQLRLYPNKNNKVDLVKVDMEEPILTPSLIPTTLEGDQIVSRLVRFSDTIAYNVTCVSMGNPHAVIFTENIDQLDLPTVGRLIENSEFFPNKTNVEFVEVLSPNRLKMRVWERGTGETLSCGTGACATLVAAVLNGLTERNATIELLGGELHIEWKKNNHVTLTGGATVVFEGTL